ncbi:dipeptidase 1 (renal) [Gonapodya sp. JEL0774]|nr:dipeptidase 1 (renal) [Gonapodya sp. JEL0774]
MLPPRGARYSALVPNDHHINLADDDPSFASNARNSANSQSPLLAHNFVRLIAITFTFVSFASVLSGWLTPERGAVEQLRATWAWDDLWENLAEVWYETVDGCTGSRSHVEIGGGHRVHAASLEAARRLMARHPLIDGHNDWPLQIRWRLESKINHAELTSLDESEFNTDIDRLREGKVGAQFWSVYVPCQQNFTSYSRNVALVLEQIDLVKRFVAKYPLTFEHVHNAVDLDAARRAGRVASLIGMEGGHSIDNSLAVLRAMYREGARYMTLTHTCHTAWADSQYPPPLHGGLTDYGRSVVREMNRLGMLVDLSHVSPDTMRDAISVSIAPAFFSHSSAAALCNTTRNVPDDVLLKVKDTDGVVMINFYPRIIDCTDVRNATISRIADHITYVRDLIGARHIGIGADFDGIETLPIGMERGVSSYPFLIAELLERGFSKAELKGILGRNLIRVLAKTEEVAKGWAVGEDQLHVNATCPDGAVSGPFR